jgi:cytidylate kinase
MRHRSDPDVAGIIGRLAAHNVQWDRMRRRIEAARADERPTFDPGRHMGPYVTVSRLQGAGGGELARLVGAALGWPALEHEVVDLVAAHLRVKPALVELFDEDAASWVSDVLGEFMPTEVVTRDSYTQEVRRVTQLLAMHGEVILLGHGANLFLPRRRGLSVRVVAALEDRIARVRTRTGLDEEHARAEIEVADKAREHFVARAFERDVSDPLLYDMVVNSSSSSLTELAEMVAGLCMKRWPRTKPLTHGVDRAGE